MANGKRYIGFTSQDPEARWKNGHGYKPTTYFGNAIDKWGWSSFKHEIWFANLTEEEGKQLEKEMIAKYHTTDKRFGYNLSEGGQGTTGYHHTDETKEIMREKKLGSKGYWEGKKLSDDHRKKLSESHKGKNLGIPRSEETKRKISETHKRNGKNKGRKLTPEQRQKYSDASTSKKSVAQIDLSSGDIINVFDSLIEASQFTGTSYTGITKCCKGRIKYSGGYKWQYI